MMNQFAIGSMINKTSINLREIYPSESKPAEIINFRIDFLFMATAFPEQGKSAHGVIHTITPDEFIKLDEIESGYDRTPAKARLQDGTEVDCFVQVFKEDILNDNIVKQKPSERQIQIIQEGCKQYGVKKEWIDHLETIDQQPRPKESELKTIEFEDEECKNKEFTREEIMKLDGSEGRAAAFVQCGYVIKALSFTKKEMQGKDLTLQFVRNMQDPIFGVPKKLEDITDLHKKNLIHNFSNFGVKSIGKFNNKDSEFLV